MKHELWVDYRAARPISSSIETYLSNVLRALDGTSSSTTPLAWPCPLTTCLRNPTLRHTIPPPFDNDQSDAISDRASSCRDSPRSFRYLIRVSQFRGVEINQEVLIKTKIESSLFRPGTLVFVRLEVYSGHCWSLGTRLDRVNYGCSKRRNSILYI